MEDDEQTAVLLANALTDQHYVVDRAPDGQSAWELAESLTYDLILLDIMLPKLDGISLLKRLRSQGQRVPVLLLTAKEAENDKVMGLDAGADDYVVKPFKLPELAARIRALLRRGGAATAPILEWGNLRLDPSKCEVTYGDRPLSLTPKEYGILEHFLRHVHQVHSRSAILDRLWSFDEAPGEETVTAHIKGLRQKLKAAGAIDLIETVYGLGYRLNPAELNSPASSPSNDRQKQQEMRAFVAKVWDKAKPNLLQQVTTIVEASGVLLAGELPAEIQQQARQQAHKLAGSLGTYGLGVGSELAKLIETTLELESSAVSAQKDYLHTLAIDLQQLVESTDARSLQQQDSPPLEATQALPEEKSPPLLLLADSDRQRAEQLSQAANRTDAIATDPQTGRTAISILAVDDDRLLLESLCPLLEPWGLKVTALDRPGEFWQVLEQTNPELVVLDLEMPEITGIELCQAIRDDSRWGWLPVLFLTSKSDAKSIQQVFAAGADDYVSKPILVPELVTRLLNRLERSRMLRSQAEIDLLTGVTNWQKSIQDINKYLLLAQRSQQPLSLVVLEIDNLKQLNQQSGHGVGDRLLREFGQLLLAEFQREDVVSRWGGAEFVVGLYGKSKAEAIGYLAEILPEIKSKGIEASAASVSPAGRRGVTSNSTLPQLPITFSAGVVQYPDDGTDLQTLYRSAQSVLCQERAAGGDRNK